MVDVKGSIVNFMVKTPVQAFLGAGYGVLAIQMYRNQSTYNFWFGKIHMEREIARNRL